MSEAEKMQQLVAIVHKIRANARPGTTAKAIIDAVDKEAEAACMDPDLFMAGILRDFYNEQRARQWLATRVRERT